MVGVSVFTAALAYTTKLIVNDVFVAKDAGAAIEVAIIVIFVSFSKSLFHYGNAVLQTVLNRSISSFYQKEAFQKTLRREISFFNGSLDFLFLIEDACGESPPPPRNRHVVDRPA